tara:strand:+ start:7417 stop:8661 length:1245 start_codon:yes stop_codon:yes gene_type:complete
VRKTKNNRGTFKLIPRINTKIFGGEIYFSKHNHKKLGEKMSIIHRKRTGLDNGKNCKRFLYILIYASIGLNIVLSNTVHAHQGKLDENGGHLDRHTGIYHCHKEGCVLPNVSRSIKITSFNIQFLGNGKNRDNAALASVVADSDIVLVQELVAPPQAGIFPDGTHYNADSEAQAFFTEMTSRGFTYYLSEEDTGTGNEIHKGSSATEWWVAFYKDQKVDIDDALLNEGLGGFLAQDRSNNPDYERVPYAFPFKTIDGSLDFVLISVHLKPGPGPTNRDRRKHELESINKWVTLHDTKEKDFLIVGDLNLYSCDVFTTMNIGQFITLNSSCLNTNTNVNGPEPFDHVLYRPQFTSEVDKNYGFRVTDLITAMKASWYSHFTHDYPGEPYSHNPFRARYSDHNPVSFELIVGTDDD